MSSQSAAHVKDLDLGVAERQAFGAAFARPKGQERLTRLVKNGTLRLPPHAEWTGDIFDWTSDPYKDRNWQFQFHTLRWLNALRWSALDGDEESADLWRRVAKSWFENNVPAESAQGLFAWKDMADGTRAIELSLGATLVDEDDDWYIELLNAHRDWLLDKTNIVKKNHALHQHSGLVVVGAVLRDGHAVDVAYDRMVEQFKTTFDAQGANDEGSIGYHQMNLRWWGHAWKRIEAESRQIPDQVAERVRLGREALAQMALPSGQLPQIGDTKRESLGPGLGPNVEYVISEGSEGVAPLETAVAYDRGYVVSRSGWGETRPLAEESHMLLRHGVDWRAHAHQDRGSVHIYAAGRPWLVDSGFHSYQTGDPTRNYFLGRSSHNIAFIPELKHDDSKKVDLVRFAKTDAYHDTVVVDRGYEGIELRRRVIYFTGPDCWLVWDESSAPNKVVQNWHVDLGVTARRHDRGFELSSGDKSLTMSWIGRLPHLNLHKAEEGDLRGWIATKWKTVEPAALITASAASDRPRNALVLGPSSPHELAIVRSYITVNGYLTMTLMRGPRVWFVKVYGEDAAVEKLERSW